MAFGFNAEETARIERTRAYDGPLRSSIFPLLEWGWNRTRCLEYLERQFGVVWRKSCRVYCPFNRLDQEALERQKVHASQVADALMLEHISLSMNPRGTLYPKNSLIRSHGHRAMKSRYAHLMPTSLRRTGLSTASGVSIKRQKTNRDACSQTRRETPSGPWRG